MGILSVCDLVQPRANLHVNDIDDDECEMLTRLATRAARGYERTAFVMLREEVTDLRARLDNKQCEP
jgi:hypothetical protein